MRIRFGTSLIELLLVLGILTTILLVGLLKTNPIRLDAARLAVEISTRRLKSVVSAGSGDESRCISAVLPIQSHVIWPPRGLQFTPDGLPRTCDGGGVGNTTILLEHRGQQAAVIVSSLGRVRWEMR